ncbi:DUF2268 domain-containing putative Zn-dependent protease [Deinococcus peraridilitoris]|uniref:DUF2268 domain-containing putative Zn-dependent protease n=1 Tax=Deinococcus peraridilitoris TaxID=432329 RepID=UPI001FE07CAF|nr:DUF2268 domain-containing putative Zn-dependent protease [Deinococcus peraridilitoris]
MQLSWAQALTRTWRNSGSTRKKPGVTGSDHAAWLFGSEAARLPRWRGYALGYKLEGRFLRRDGGSASTSAP